nr:translation initiation factor IF-2-like [Pongo pygmaeus]
MAPPRPAALCPDPRPLLGAGPGPLAPHSPGRTAGLGKQPRRTKRRVRRRARVGGAASKPRSPENQRRGGNEEAGGRASAPSSPSSGALALGRRRPTLFQPLARIAGAPGRSPSLARPESHKRPPRERQSERSTNVYRVPTGCLEPGGTSRGCGWRNPSRPCPLGTRGPDQEGGPSGTGGLRTAVGKVGGARRRRGNRRLPGSGDPRADLAPQSLYPFKPATLTPPRLPEAVASLSLRSPFPPPGPLPAHHLPPPSDAAFSSQRPPRPAKLRLFPRLAPRTFVFFPVLSLVVWNCV